MNIPHHAIRWVAATALLACIAGCSSTPINFEGPAGSVIFVDGKPYHLPSQVELWRPAGVGQSNKYDIRLVFTTPQGDVHAKGQALVFGYTESDMDKMVVNACKFSDEDLANLVNGKVLLYKVATSSHQPLMDLTLTKE